MPELEISTIREALSDAHTVALIVHGVGDHAAVEILREAAHGPKSLWGEKATTTTIGIEGFPVPEDINFFSLKPKAAEALQVAVDSQKHIVLPVIWSGARQRAGRWASQGEGPMRFTNALPLLLSTCFNLLGCVPRASGAWIPGVLFFALLCTLVIGSFIVFMSYVIINLPWWLGAPSYRHWYQLSLAFASWVLMGFVIKRASLAFDLIGDVAYYVAQNDMRSKNIEQMSKMISLIAESAPNSFILVVGHSLGSVLVSQALARLPATYSGKARTLLLTMGSPLKLMSWIFPNHIHSPDSLLNIYRHSGLILKWVNLWRTKDVIGKALRPRLPQGFDEASLGIGGHADYWSDERVWIAIAQIMRDPASSSLTGLDHVWQSLPLSKDEERQLSQIWDRWRAVKNFFWYLVILTIFWQINHILPWQRKFPPLLHALIVLAWNAGLFSLAFGTYLLWKWPSHDSPRDLLHYLTFMTVRARIFLLSGSMVLMIISTIRAFHQ